MRQGHEPGYSSVEILILNLMPLKEETETQLMRALSNTPPGGLYLLMLSTHVSKTRQPAISTNFMFTFDDIKKKKFDG